MARTSKGGDHRTARDAIATDDARGFCGNGMGGIYIVLML